MRSVIISIFILMMIIGFAVGNTIYTNMKLSDISELASNIDSENLGERAADIRHEWNKLSRHLRISVIDTKIRSVTSAVERLYQISKGADDDLMIARAELMLALEGISSIERPTLSQIF